ncbi:MAG: HEAT repeat domain-containing protein [Steroidobacteraceae bacterium]
MSRRYEAIAAAVIFVAIASATPAVARRGLSAPSRCAEADTLVAKLRDLPLPLRAFPRGIASKQATQRPLPALELRREKVYDELHALGPASVPALARALRDPDAGMRRDVVVALGVLAGGWWHFPDGASRLDIRPALPALVTALQDSDPQVRAWAAADIGSIGAAAASAVPGLRAMLHSQEAGSRGSACSALGAIGPAARMALPDLRQALGDSSPQVRQSARAAIVSITAPAAR